MNHPPPATRLDVDLSADELDALDAFLAAPAVEGTSMDVSMLEGFFAALAIGRRLILPSIWLPLIWDVEHGKVEPKFKGFDHANEVLNLVMRRYNAVLGRINAGAAGFEPIFLAGPQWGAAEWCEGFIAAMRLAPTQWTVAIDASPEWFLPFFALGTDAGFARLEEENGGGQRHVDAIVPSLARIQAYFRESAAQRSAGLVQSSFPMGGRARQPAVRDALKVGRNEPCPCGSGRKYKRCCGAVAAAAP